MTGMKTTKVMLAIIKATVWSRRWSTLWWTLGIAVYIALVIGVYPSFRDQAAALNDSFKQMPDAVKALIADSNDFLSPAGYMVSQLYYVTLPIIYGILCIGLGTSLLARDEQDHTMELVLSRPVSRGTLLAARAAAGIGILSLVVASTVIATLVMAGLVDLGLGAINLIAVTIVSALVPLIFGALAFMFTALGAIGRIASTGIVTLLLIASYVFTSLAGTVTWLQWPAKLLPYHYFHPTPILNGESAWPEALGMVAVIIIGGIVAYLGFRRRDIS